MPTLEAVRSFVLSLLPLRQSVVGWVGLWTDVARADGSRVGTKNPDGSITAGPALARPFPSLASLIAGEFGLTRKADIDLVIEALAAGDGAFTTGVVETPSKFGGTYRRRWLKVDRTGIVIPAKIG